MPLKKVRKNAKKATKQAVIANNMAILINHNKKLPAKKRRKLSEIHAAALTAAGIKQKKPGTK